MFRIQRRTAVLLIPGLVAFLIAALSVADMFLPRPYDGVVLESDSPQARVVRQVVPGSGADRAGIRPGDVIVGVDRTFLDDRINAQELFNRHRFGDRVAYLNRSAGHIFEESRWSWAGAPWAQRSQARRLVVLWQGGLRHLQFWRAADGSKVLQPGGAAGGTGKGPRATI